MSFAVAFVGWYLVTIAWEACESDLGIGTSYELWGLFGLMIIAGWPIFYVGCVLTHPNSTLVRLVAGTALVVAAALAVVTANVPRSDPAEYRQINHQDHPECRADGVPTWWPAWLPS